MFSERPACPLVVADGFRPKRLRRWWYTTVRSLAAQPLRQQQPQQQERRDRVTVSRVAPALLLSAVISVPDGRRAGFDGSARRQAQRWRALDMASSVSLKCPEPQRTLSIVPATLQARDVYSSRQKRALAMLRGFGEATKPVADCKRAHR